MTPVRQSSYYVYAAVEFAGMLLIFWDGVPIFRQLLISEQGATATDRFIMAFAAALVQFSYWKCLRHDPPFVLPRSPFFAHAVLFVSRLSFVFASSIFGLVIYRTSSILEFSAFKAVLFLAVMFSVFCFSKHLEQLGALMGKR